MKLLIRLLALAVLLLGACALLLALVSGRAGQDSLRVHVADSTPRSVLVDASGDQTGHKALHLALLATNAGSCPPEPTAAAQRVGVRPDSDGWSTTRRLSPRNGGLAASLVRQRDLSGVARVCGWLTATPGPSAPVLASASDSMSRDWLALARSGLIVALGMALAACALFLVAARISIHRDRGRARKHVPFAPPAPPRVVDHAPAQSTAVTVPAGDQAPAGARPPRRPIAGHDGDVSWAGQPDPGPLLDPARLTNFEPNDPRLN